MIRSGVDKPVVLACTVVACSIFLITAWSAVDKQQRAVSLLLAEEGGIGTFPGGQSTGGYREFDFEQPVPYDDSTATETERLRRLKAKVSSMHLCSSFRMPEMCLEATCSWRITL